MCIPEEEEECLPDTAPLSPQWSLETKAEVSSSPGSTPLSGQRLIAEGCQHPAPSGFHASFPGKAGRMVRSQVTTAPHARAGS